MNDGEGEENKPQINTTTINNKKKKKRKRSDDTPPPPPPGIDLRNSAYFKICHIVRQLRPNFIQVLQTPNYRDCQAAHEIRKRMMLVMDLYKHMQIEGREPPKVEASVPQHLSSENKPKLEQYLDGLKKEKPQQEHHQTMVAEKSGDKKALPDQISLGKKEVDKLHPRGSYVVGGSVSGWNFITFINRRPPVYYGRTKESFRLSHEFAC